MSERLTKETRKSGVRKRAPWITLLLALAAVALWGGYVSVGALRGWFRESFAATEEASAFAAAAKAKIERENMGNTAFVLIEDGRIAYTYFASRGTPVDENSLFQVASLSKWLSAWGVLHLAAEGLIDLDAPVSTYLTRWKLPESEFDNSEVSVRRLLSHTAGLTDGLGYGGFAPGQPVQSLEASLSRASDASPGADGRVRVGARPGATFRYSGGGYALLQLLIEEVTGEDFNGYMKHAVFDPLGMTRSTFVLADDAQNVAEFFAPDGRKATHFRFSAPAASSLYTTAADLARFIGAHRPGLNGEPVGRGVLPPDMLVEMQRPHGFQYGVEIWGLGTILYAPNNSGGFIIGHDGSNAPAINTSARLDPATGDGVIVLETGNERLATRLGGEWVFWKTGNVDTFEVLAAIPGALRRFASGALAILFSALALLWVTRR